MSDDYMKHRGPKHEGETHASPYPISRLAPTHDLIDVAREIQTANDMIKSHVHGKLRMIADQIRALQDHARTILERAQQAAELHAASCQFKKRPGHVYYAYRHTSDELYLSMLSPDDWNGAPPHEFAGAYRLEADMSWTRVEEIQGEDDLDRLLRLT